MGRRTPQLLAALLVRGQIGAVEVVVAHGDNLRGPGGPFRESVAPRHIRAYIDVYLRSLHVCHRGVKWTAGQRTMKMIDANKVPRTVRLS